MFPDEITFLRKRDYRFVRELGAGACGLTMLLLDDEIDEQYVCKKYAPASETWRAKLFTNFINEIKVLHRVYHRNVVRIFNYYIYKDRKAGYILMEFIDGMELDRCLAEHPEDAGPIFAQVVSGFRHLEENRILHRDIRPANILVRNDGVVKIIDFGFGKEIAQSQDFDRSISLNWWCETPDDFATGRYDFATEVYFVGKLFDAYIREYGIEGFPYLALLGKMCQKNPAARISSFVEVDQFISDKGLSPDEFTELEIWTYRRFSSEVYNAILSVESTAQFESEAAKIELQLEQAFRSCLLEETVPDAALVLRCIIRGQYSYRRDGLTVGVLKEFVAFLKSCSKAKKNIVISNLQTKLNSRPKYTQEEEVPF